MLGDHCFVSIMYFDTSVFVLAVIRMYVHLCTYVCMCNILYVCICTYVRMFIYIIMYKIIICMCT